jgi:hypothetical protein
MKKRGRSKKGFFSSRFLHGKITNEAVTLAVPGHGGAGLWLLGHGGAGLWPSSHGKKTEKGGPAWAKGRAGVKIEG